jgi:hypothetical protein
MQGIPEPRRRDAGAGLWKRLISSTAKRRQGVAPGDNLGYTIAPCPNGPTIQEPTMPIDLSAVNWLYVAILSGFAFVASLLGNIIAFRSRFLGSIFAAILFAVAFVFWTYYPHGIALPLSAK